MSRLALLLLLFVGCAREPFSAEELELLASLRLDSRAPPPASPTNPYADDDDAAALGERLFFDRRLSDNGEVACATCHVPALRFTDGRATARGLDDVPRHTPTLLGVARLPFLGWDGKKDSLWAQALAPLEDAREHGLSRERLAALVGEHYGEPFARAFGSHDDDVEVARHTAFALEAYLRRLQPAPAPFDRYVSALLDGDAKGGGHLSASAVRGLQTFLREGQCVHCHHGPHLTDGSFHNLGLPALEGGPELTHGRAAGANALLADPLRCGGPLNQQDDCAELRFLDPTFEDFVGAFKTPTLRDVARTAPYMHDGQLATLEEVLRFYKEPPGEAAVGHRDLLLEQVDEDLDVVDLVAFLESLSGD